MRVLTLLCHILVPTALVLVAPSVWAQTPAPTNAPSNAVPVAQNQAPVIQQPQQQQGQYAPISNAPAEAEAEAAASTPAAIPAPPAAQQLQAPQQEQQPQPQLQPVPVTPVMTPVANTPPLPTTPQITTDLEKPVQPMRALRDEAEAAIKALQAMPRKEKTLPPSLKADAVKTDTPESVVVKKEEAPAVKEVTDNQGIDMNLDPKLVQDEEIVPAVEDAPIPYEEQLRMRTEELDQQARNLAFDRTKKGLLPLEPYEIRDLLRRLKETQQAIQTPVRKPPTPQNTIRTITTDPSVPSQVVHLAVGRVTALNIVDITGATWPVVDIAFGGNFDIKAPEPGGSMLRITPLRDFAKGNMIIRLLSMITPITFELEAGGDVVDYRFDARIPEYGPNAKMPIIENGGIDTTAGDSTITSILEGVAPANSEKLVVEGVDARTSAYRLGGLLYVRTPLSLLSPAWRSSATSADGINVYALAEAPVLLLSDQGNLVRARLSVLSKSGS